MASWGSSISRSFRPRLLKDLFACRQCLQSQNYATKSTLRRQLLADLSIAPTAQRGNLTILSLKTRQFFSHNLRKSFSSSTFANAAEEGAREVKSSFPQVSDKSVAYWLLGSAVSVFGIVVFGGLTRLTESGCVFT